MLDNHNVRICRVDRFRVVVPFCPTKVIRIVELCKKMKESVRKFRVIVSDPKNTHLPAGILVNNNIYYI